MAAFIAEPALVFPRRALSRSTAVAFKTAVTARAQVSFAAAPAELFLARLISGNGLRLAAARLCVGCLGHNCRYCRSSLGNWLHLLKLLVQSLLDLQQLVLKLLLNLLLDLLKLQTDLLLHLLLHLLHLPLDL